MGLHMGMILSLCFGNCFNLGHDQGQCHGLGQCQDMSQFHGPG